MRTIKYRQYLGNGNWHYWGYLEDGVFTHPLVSLETRSPSQQYTGLLDKNNKEIYEKNILRLILLGGYANGVVGEQIALVEEWGKVVVKKEIGEDLPRSRYKSFTISPHFEHPSILFEVIGNIYEHPHLLTNSI